MRRYSEENEGRHVDVAVWPPQKRKELTLAGVGVATWWPMAMPRNTVE